MKTEIFESYAAFIKREDKTVNGVSPEFARENPDFSKENESNKGCWNCSYCFGCSRCSDCVDCSDCSDCFHCSGCSGQLGDFTIPVIEDIHKRVLDAVSQESALEMSAWHTCDTTHCRAGWVVVLAGEAGKELEGETSTLFAAMQIYKASSDIKVPPTRFFDSNIAAMVDIKRCAELEVTGNSLNYNLNRLEP